MKQIATQTASFLQATAGSKRAPKKKYTVSSKNVSNVQLTTMDEQIVWHSCVLWLTCRGS